MLFHRFPLEGGFEICKACDVALEKEFFKALLISEQSQTSSSSPAERPESTSVRKMTFVEENAVRYTAGYIIRTLETQFSQKSTQENIECLRVLKEMAGKLRAKDTTSCTQSSEWTRLVDRGGLYHVEDIEFELSLSSLLS